MTDLRPIRHLFCLLLAASGLTATVGIDGAAADAGDTTLTATQFLEAHDARVRAVVGDSDADSLSTADRTQVRELINEAFDFRELSRLSLGDSTWGQRTESERDEFVDVYRRIVEERNLDIFVRYHRGGGVAYVGEEVDGDGRVTVVAEVPVKQETKQILYALHRAGADDSWRIYDVTIDGAGTVEANRRAWGRYVARHSYTKLLEQLRKRLERITSAG